MDTREMPPRMMIRNLKLTSCCMLLACLLGGCSTFNRDWRNFEAEHDEPVAGLWKGTWLSHANGHHGGLRCIMTPRSDSIYDAHYRASYRKILRFEYTVPMRVRSQAGGYSFTGDADLGAMAGGLYTYSGSITGHTFRAKYSSKLDWGVFDMERAPAQ